MTCQTVDECSFESKNCCNQDDWECKALLVYWPLLGSCAVLCYFTTTPLLLHLQYIQIMAKIWLLLSKILQIYRINLLHHKRYTANLTRSTRENQRLKSQILEFWKMTALFISGASLGSSCWFSGGVSMCHLSQLPWESQGKTSPGIKRVNPVMLY